MIPGISGGHDIAFIDVERAASGVTSALKAERLHLDPSSDSILHSRLPDKSAPLFVLGAGRFSTQKAAERARQSCPGELVVMRSRVFPGLKLPTYFLGAVLAQHSDAEAARAAFKKCSDGPNAEIIEYPSAGAQQPAQHPATRTGQGCAPEHGKQTTVDIGNSCSVLIGQLRHAQLDHRLHWIAPAGVRAVGASTFQR
jgi:hypothetical protein